MFQHQVAVTMQMQQRKVQEEEPSAMPCSEELGFVALFVAPPSTLRLGEPLMRSLGARP